MNVSNEVVKNRVQAEIDEVFYKPSRRLLSINIASLACDKGSLFRDCTDEVSKGIVNSLGSRTLSRYLENAPYEPIEPIRLVRYILVRIAHHMAVCIHNGTGIDLKVLEGACHFGLLDFLEKFDSMRKRDEAFLDTSGRKKLSKSLSLNIANLLVKYGLIIRSEDGLYYFNEMDEVVVSQMSKKVFTSLGVKVADKFSKEDMEDAIENEYRQCIFEEGESTKELMAYLSSNAWFSVDANVCDALAELAESISKNKDKFLSHILSKAPRRLSMYSLRILRLTLNRSFAVGRVSRSFAKKLRKVDRIIEKYRNHYGLDYGTLSNNVRPQYFIDKLGCFKLRGGVVEASSNHGLFYYVFGTPEYYKLESKKAVDIFTAELAKRYGFFGSLKEQVRWVHSHSKLIRETANGNHRDPICAYDIAFKIACREYLRFISEGQEEFRTNMICSVAMDRPQYFKEFIPVGYRNVLNEDGTFIEEAKLWPKSLKRFKTFRYTTRCRTQNSGKEHINERSRMLDEEIHKRFLQMFTSKYGTRDLPCGGLRANRYVQGHVALFYNLIRHFPDDYHSFSSTQLNAYNYFVYESNRLHVSRAKRNTLWRSIKHDEKAKTISVVVKHSGRPQLVSAHESKVMSLTAAKMSNFATQREIYLPAINSAFTEAFCKLILEVYDGDDKNFIIDTYSGIVAGNPNDLIKLTAKGLGGRLFEIYEPFVGGEVQGKRSRFSHKHTPPSSKTTRLFN